MCRPSPKSFRSFKRLSLLVVITGTVALASCSSNLPFVRQNRAASRIFLSDFSTAWTAALEAVSMGKNTVQSNNRETGIINSVWIDNSEFRNFLDVFTNEDFFLRSRYRLQVHVREGLKNNQQAILIRVLKQSQKELTFMGGWEEVESDGIEESVVLYRIGRLIAIQQATETQEANPREFDDDDTIF